MPSFIFTAAALASLAFSAAFVSVSAFDSAATDNLAVYWGQGNAQKSLGSFCDDDTIDIIPIGFVNVFPDEAGSNGYPGTNFGNACGGFYTTSGGQTTQLLASCPALEADIKACQAQGKKILLSLGGGGATAAYVATDASAVQFADFLWGAFGPQTDDWIADGNPRPFGDAVVDGFDFDIESLAADIPTTIDNGYAAMANEFRRLFSLCTSSQSFYLSAAPQCIVPDGHLADALSKAVFDFLFVQFYNTPQCSARAHFDSTYGQVANAGVPTDISYDMWITWVLATPLNKATKVYIGLPAALGAAESSDYLSLTEAGQLIQDFKCKYPANFGGVMLWEATYSDNNQINGQSYAQNIKPLLTGCSCPASTTSSSLTSSTTTTTSSTTSPTSTTVATSTTSTTSVTTSSTWTGSYSFTFGSSVSTPASAVSSSATSSTTTSSSSTPVNGQLTSSSSSSTSTSPSSSSCAWGSACSTRSTSNTVDGASTSTATSTSSSTFSTPTGWSTFGTCTSSTCRGLATGPATSADPTTSTWPSWSANPASSSSSSATLTSTWTIARPTDPATSTSIASVVTMTIVPVPSSVWYASTFSLPSSTSVWSLSLASIASAAPPPMSSSTTVKSAIGSSASSWPIVSAPTISTSTTTPVLPAVKMTTVSVAQGATWSSDPSLTVSPNKSTVQATNATPFTTFTGGASRSLGMGASSVWSLLGALGLFGLLVL